MKISFLSLLPLPKWTPFPAISNIKWWKGHRSIIKFPEIKFAFFFFKLWIQKGYLETAFIGFLLQNILGLKKKSWIQKGCMHFFCNWVVADRATRAEKSASVTDSSHSLLFGLLFIFVTNEAINLITDNLLQPFVSLRSFIIRHTSLDSKHWRARSASNINRLNHACNLPDNKFYITLLIN